VAKRQTQAEIADYFGVTTQTLRNYKNGSIEEQRRYYAYLKYYEDQHKGWEIDYRHGIATHPNLVVKITKEPVQQDIGDKVVMLGFSSKGKDYGLKILEIDKPLWDNNIEENGKTLAKLARGLGDVFSPEIWESEHIKPL